MRKQSLISLESFQSETAPAIRLTPMHSSTLPLCLLSFLCDVPLVVQVVMSGSAEPAASTQISLESELHFQPFSVISRRGDKMMLFLIYFVVLQTIRVTQNENGLRHGDYMRYRQYCARKLRRMRKNLGMVLADKSHRFKPHAIQASNVKDKDWLMIPLMNAERGWAYAMQLKSEIQSGEEEEGRRKR